MLAGGASVVPTAFVRGGLPGPTLLWESAQKHPKTPRIAQVKALENQGQRGALRIESVWVRRGWRNGGGDHRRVMGCRLLGLHHLVIIAAIGEARDIIAEIELSALTRQCLDRRLPDIETMSREVDAWERDRNVTQTGVNWRFTTKDARIRLKRLYPQIEA